MSSQFSSNSEVAASELLENWGNMSFSNTLQGIAYHEEMLVLIICIEVWLVFSNLYNHIIVCYPSLKG